MECFFGVGICIFLLAYIIANKEKEIEFVKLITFSFIFYFFLYIVISSLFFCLDIFTIKRVVVVEFLLLFACAVFWLVKSKKTKLNIFFNYKSWSLEIFVIFIGSAFALGSYDTYGMGQDEGVYHQKAITLIYGITENEQTLSDYEELPEGTYKEFYYDNLMPNLLGYDLNYDFNKSGSVPFVTDSMPDSSEGVWHGIPVYPAILALSGKIAGISHMTDIHFLFYIIFLCLVKFICDNLSIDRKCSALAVLLMGLSPEILWVTKSSLVEIFLSVIILTYIYFLTVSDRRKQVYSVIPVWIFSLYHVSIYTMMPMFIVVYWLLYIWKNERRYIWYVCYILEGYYIGFWSMICLQAGYTLEKNYGRPLRWIPVSYMIQFITVMVIMGLLCNFFVLRHGGLIRSILREKGDLCKKIISAALMLMLLFMIKDVIISEQMLEFLCSRVWVKYAVLSGFLLLPLTAVKILSSRYEWNVRNSFLIIMFMWSVAVYATFLKKEATYYYYTRYLAPYLVVIILLFLILYNEKKTQCMAVLIIACISVIPQSYLVKSMKDDSRVTWKVVEGVLENIHPDDIVIMDTNLMYAFYFPIKAAGGHVYPLMDSVKATMEEINADGGNILYLTGEIGEAEALYQLQYRQPYYASEDSGGMRSRFLKLPTRLSYIQEKKILSLYQVMQYQDSYEIHTGNKEVFGSGWSSINTSGYSWMDDIEESYIYLYIQEDREYEMVFYTGDIVPLEQLDRDAIEVVISMNDVQIATVMYQNEESFKVRIPEEIVHEGRNKVQLKAEMWSPKEYGAADERDLGISLYKIRVNIVDD